MKNDVGGVARDCAVGDAAAVISHSADLIRSVLQRPGYAFSDAELLGRIYDLYAMASVVEAAKLALVAELQNRPETVAGARPGRAAYTFLTEALRVSGPQANRDVAAAAALASASPELPRMRQALIEGEVSREHLDVAVSVMRRLPKKLKRAVIEPEAEASTPEAEPTPVEPSPEVNPTLKPEPDVPPMTGAELIDEILTGQAKQLPPTTVDRLGRHIVRRLDPNRTERFDPDAYERRTCSIGTDFAGMGIYRLIVDPATHLQLRALIARWSAPRPVGQAVDETGDIVSVKDVRTPTQRQADAMVDLLLAGGADQPVARDDADPDDADPDDTDPDDTDTDDADPDNTAHAHEDREPEPTPDTVAEPDEAAVQQSPRHRPQEHGPTNDGCPCSLPPSLFLAPPVVSAEVTIIATLDQFAAAYGAHDPAALQAGLARMSLAGTVGDFTGATVLPEVLARLSCDSPIRRLIIDENGVPLHHGRARRFASEAQKRALAARDGGCVVPGCPAPPEWTEAHHLTPWEKGGTTDIDAMMLLCSRHHTAHHAGVYDIELRAGTAWVRVPAWQDIRRPWLANISATHGTLAQRVARVLGAQAHLPWGSPDDWLDGQAA